MLKVLNFPRANLKVGLKAPFVNNLYLTQQCRNVAAS